MKFKTFVIMMLAFSGFCFSYQYEEKIDKTFNLGPDGIFKLSNINGSVTTTTHDKDIIIIKTIKSTKRESNLDRIEVRFQHEGNRLKVSVHKNKKWRRINFKVIFVVKLPQKLKSVSLSSVNGAVKTNGLYRDLAMKTVNGGIYFKGEFKDGDFDTVNGKVSLYHAKPLQGDVSIRTVNGGVRFELDKDSSFEINGGTVNGRIRSEFNAAVKKRFVGSKIRGDVNGGKYMIRIKTVNGGIRLRAI